MKRASVKGEIFQGVFGFFLCGSKNLRGGGDFFPKKSYKLKKLSAEGGILTGFGEQSLPLDGKCFNWLRFLRENATIPPLIFVITPIPVAKAALFLGNFVQFA